MSSKPSRRSGAAATPSIRPSSVPFCLNCFCPADDAYKRAFWEGAPEVLKDEVSMLERSLDRLGEILIRNQKLKTPQLLEALREQERTGELLGKILLLRGWVTQTDIDEALALPGLPAPRGYPGSRGDAGPRGGRREPGPDSRATTQARGAQGRIRHPPRAPATGETRDQAADRWTLLQGEAAAQGGAAAADFGASTTSSIWTPTARTYPSQGRAHLDIEGHDFDLLVQTLPRAHGNEHHHQARGSTLLPEELHGARTDACGAAVSRARARCAVGPRHGDLASLQRRDDDLVLTHGPRRQIRAESREHRALHPVGSSVRPPDGGQPGQRARFRRGAALGRGRQAGRRVPARAQRQSHREPRLPARDDSARHHHVHRRSGPPSPSIDSSSSACRHRCWRAASRSS